MNNIAKGRCLSQFYQILPFSFFVISPNDGPKFSAETCRVYEILMNVRTFVLLYWSDN
jgi:hypothetical protein